MTKSGHPECSDEARQCVWLGDDVCPRILSTGTDAALGDFYVMERLAQAKRAPGLLREIETLLENFVWSRSAYWTSRNWHERFAEKYHFRPPAWIVDESEVETHGDPTASNALRRGEQLILCDPAPRPYAPKHASVDRGKILQSLAGWETVAYGQEPVDFEPPAFCDEPEKLAAAVFWLGVHVLGVMQRERRRPTQRAGLMDWCGHLHDACFSAVVLR